MNQANRNYGDLLQVALIYIVIAISGYLTWHYTQSMGEVQAFLIADIVMTVVCFLFSIVKKNSSVYDAYWSVIPFFFIVMWSYLHPSTPSIYHFIAFAVVFIWSWRLTLNWIRSWPDFSHEDWRYTKLSADTGAMYPLVNFFGIHLFPTLLVFGGMWPMFFMFQNSISSLVLFILGAIVSFIGTLFEFFADNELAKFRRRPNPKVSEILDTGLWSRCRHPNYLGEMLFWIGLFIIGLSFGAPLYTGVGALSMILLFVFASIPMKEKRMMQRRPDNFMSYKARVPLLLPKL
jgi:steroid 5-alpha reductase family enzyme